MATPIAIFENAWVRCDLLSTMYAYLAGNATRAIQPEELLRAEWVARVSTLDLYIHELVAQRMVDVFNGTRQVTPAFNRFAVSNETMSRIRLAPSQDEARKAFELEVRRQLSVVTYQMPDSIADGIRMVSSVELWNSIVIHQGVQSKDVVRKAKELKRNLAMIIERRNKIAHEGDMQPSIPRIPWPIDQSELLTVRQVIDAVVRAIEAVA
ncbi:MAG: hypothetical protein H6R07_371 [Proteobacteria bacterium]|nr:hypothetical protein [Pseudomonadota bacterium]